MPSASSTLYIIDGHAQMFRSYFAIRSPMTSPVTGEPTNACFAFTGMLLKLFEQHQPQLVCMAIDSPGPSFRNELFPAYKANREEAPQEFKAQIPRMLELAEAFGIPVIGQAGVEADDLIATLVERVRRDPGHGATRVRIVSKDKDLEQLIDDQVTLFDIHSDTELTLEGLLEKRGITPAQVVDLLTLTGDTADNIPGVTGIGPKTAGALLAEFTSLDNLLARLDEVKGKKRENLEAAREQFPLVRRLVSLLRDVDMPPLDLDDLRQRKPDGQRLQELFRTLGLRQHEPQLRTLTGVDAIAPAKAVAPAREKQTEPFGLFAAAEQTQQEQAPQVTRQPVNGDYTAITTSEQLRKLVATLAQCRAFAVDTETAALGWRTGLCGISFAWESGSGVYVPVRSSEPHNHLDQATVIEALRPVLADKAITKIGHNLKYDMLVLRHAGAALQGPCFDTMIAAHLTSQPGLKLDDLALALLQLSLISLESLIGPSKGRGKATLKSVADLPLVQIVPYAAEDADVAWRLYEYFQPLLTDQQLEDLATHIEMPLVGVLADMEHQGIALDRAILASQRKVLEKRLDTLREQIQSAAGRPFNLDSPRQLATLLFEDMKLPVIKRTRTGPSTDVEVLEQLAEAQDIPQTARQLAIQLLDYRQLSKLVGTYLTALDEAVEPSTGRIHASFHQTGAATGRLSSSNPNLQNIPIRTELGRQIRKAFVAPPQRVLIAADYSQIELRMLAHLSEDPALMQAFAQDQDIHRAVAAQVFNVASPDDVTAEQRDHAKMINFGIIYGITPFGLARRVATLDLDAARVLIDDYKKRFAGIDRFLQQCIEKAHRDGWVSTITGRRRAIPQIRTPRTRALGERLAINSVVQGSAADLIKTAMVQLHDRITREAQPIALLLQIHDELVVETPREHAQASADLLKEVMEAAMDLRVPLKVDTGMGEDWFAAK